MNNNINNLVLAKEAKLQSWTKPELSIISINQETLGGPDPVADLGVGTVATS